MAKVWRYLCCASLAAECLLATRFTTLCWDKPWPDPILTIDGKSYLKGAAGAKWATIFKLQDLYHSPGYQLYLRLLFAACGSMKALIHTSKVVSLLMFFATALLLYRIGHRWFQPAVAGTAVAIFLFSESWTYYSNMIQYEVLTGFLLLLFLSMLMAAESSISSKLSLRCAVAMGLVLAFLSLIQMRYVVLLVIPPLYVTVIQRKNPSIRNLLPAGIVLLTAVVLLAVWSIALSLDQGRTVFLMDGSEFRFHVANNPNAMGYSFPYPEVVEPSGWQFILSMPGPWLWLIGQRALYLFGIKRDIWALPPEGFTSGPIGSYSLLDAFSTIVFTTGFILTVSRVRRRQLGDEPAAGMLLLACMILPPLLIFGSKRFIIPVIPLIALFQGYAIVVIAQALRNDRQKDFASLTQPVSGVLHKWATIRRP